MKKMERKRRNLNVGHVEEGMPGIDACHRPKEHTFLSINDTRLSTIIAKQGFGTEILRESIAVL